VGTRGLVPLGVPAQRITTEVVLPGGHATRKYVLTCRAVPVRRLVVAGPHVPRTLVRGTRVRGTRVFVTPRLIRYVLIQLGLIPHVLFPAGSIPPILIAAGSVPPGRTTPGLFA
jgi:hypothetical protein